MRAGLIAALYILVLASFAGVEAIRRVPSVLHSAYGTGLAALGGIAMVGGILIAGSASARAEVVLGVAAVALGAAGAVGGFLAVNRALRGFARAPEKASLPATPPT